ncbi:MAG: CRISPR-associated protein Cas4 [Candidatus Heimdallarchaeum endolithica]|uniref:CRISPR-associated exonuclease Cas4 n=1 Tax=Candidatus Heimdallarchaeum endolithica TaxID=2876572 RepID=A0A9Y1BPQ3_9ARCH|nr:MAG: CRISPR-associated protein Cas4 [Candidatus Heimdallarchaeum endolithica]
MLNEFDFFRGLQINYSIVCKTKLWLFSYNMGMEQSSEEVRLGSFIHEVTYPRMKKNIIVDNKIAIDFLKKGEKLILHEIKKSQSLEDAHKYQLYYYIYYLKRTKKIELVEGIIDYPLVKKRINLTLNAEIEKKLENILAEIKEILAMPSPPKPEKKSYCRKCAYFEFCWV